MKRLLLLAALMIAGAAHASPAKYYMDGIVTCDKAVVTAPNLAYCRLLSGGDPAGLLYAIDITKADRPVVERDGFMKVDPVAHMKILALSDQATRMESSQCADILVENDVITWVYGRPLVDCLKARTITPTK